MTLTEILTQAYGEPNAWAESQLSQKLVEARKEELIQIYADTKLLGDTKAINKMVERLAVLNKESKTGEVE